jgi:hypothetical protein
MSDSVQHVKSKRVRSYGIHNKRRKYGLSMECLSVLLLLILWCCMSIRKFVDPMDFWLKYVHRQQDCFLHY